MLYHWIWVTGCGHQFGLTLQDFREAGINPERRTPRLNYAILGDLIEDYMNDSPREPLLR